MRKIQMLVTIVILALLVSCSLSSENISSSSRQVTRAFSKETGKAAETMDGSTRIEVKQLLKDVETFMKESDEVKTEIVFSSGVLSIGNVWGESYGFTLSGDDKTITRYVRNELGGTNLSEVERELTVQDAQTGKKTKLKVSDVKTGNGFGHVCAYTIGKLKVDIVLTSEETKCKINGKDATMDEVYSLEKNFVKYDRVLRYNHEYEIMSGEEKTYTIETYSNPANKKDKVYLEEATTIYEGNGKDTVATITAEINGHKLTVKGYLDTNRLYSHEFLDYLTAKYSHSNRNWEILSLEYDGVSYRY